MASSNSTKAIVPTSIKAKFLHPIGLRLPHHDEKLYHAADICIHSIRHFKGNVLVCVSNFFFFHNYLIHVYKIIIIIKYVLMCW